MQLQLSLGVVEGRVELVRPMDPAALDDHHHLFAGCAEGRHDLMDILAQLLGITVGHDCREDCGRAILDCSHDTEQHAAGDPAPGARVHPRLAFERLFTSDVTLAQGTRGETITLGAAPPTQPGEGEAPQAGFLFVEEHDRAPTGSVLQGSEFE